MKRRTRIAIKALHPNPKTLRRRINNAARKLSRLRAKETLQRITGVSKRPVKFIGLAEQIKEASEALEALKYEEARTQMRDLKLGIHADS